MQFIWLHVEDLIGKGVPISILARFFFYACLSSTPMALPLAILLAALMSFGNLGERLELLSMKTAGISLFKIMRSQIVFISMIVIGAFFFSNDIIPIAQKRMWTLMFSFRNQSPELDIPVGEFYSGIRSMNIYVRSKDFKTKDLCNVMIYDFSDGFESASVTTADTMKVKVTADKKNLVISMKNGEYFENLQKQAKNRNNIPYRREVFDYKELLIDFDSNFKELSESMLENQHVSKNIQRLTRDIDSINNIRDSLKVNYGKNFLERKVLQQAYEPTFIEKRDSLPVKISTVKRNPDSLFLACSQSEMKNIAQAATSSLQSLFSDIQYNTIVINDADNFFMRHNSEWHRKFTLSFACLIFFFIGAPLGAIIGKGGLGMPAVVSVLLFIVYYIIDTMGKKFANEGVWEVWQGMWLSSAVLLPIGIFLSYKAAKDAEMFNRETYIKLFDAIKKIFSYNFYKDIMTRLSNLFKKSI
jgi:lipopolysaccharide export system permease protein